MATPIMMNIHPDVLVRVSKEVVHQNQKWGTEHIKSQSVPGHLLVLRKLLQRAEQGWLEGLTGRTSAEGELLQLTAVALQALNNIYLEREAEKAKP
ncbi:hypothetical protein [Rheinheimera faecalis]|uniref:hypothetical protein n=1 Tax=Rheinheimera faecalis TaxID=2901141 RepID=UPI001E3E0080|nr:hypothetical protein [Rheinheimera faecalis]